MPVFAIKRHVSATPEHVFGVATDFRRAPEFIRGIKKVEVLTEGPVGVGTRFRETRMMFKREATEEMVVSVFEPPTRYTLESESCGCRYHSEFHFTRTGSGTDMEFRFDAQPLSMMAKILSILFRPMMKGVIKMIENDLDDVKAAAEATPHAKK